MSLSLSLCLASLVYIDTYIDIDSIDRRCKPPAGRSSKGGGGEWGYIRAGVRDRDIVRRVLDRPVAAPDGRGGG